MSQDGNAGAMSPAHLENIDFLRVVFGKHWGEAHVTGFRGDPQDRTMPRRVWGGDLALNWRFQQEDNNYFAVSLFTGKRRVKEEFREMRVLGMDDVGNTVDPVEVRALFGDPTFRIETSSGNEQWGYRLAEPIRDVAVADALIAATLKRLVGSGPDPGQAGVTRYLRLPMGTNGKPKNNGFCTRLLQLADRDLTPERIHQTTGVDTRAGVSPVSTATVLPFPGTSRRFDDLVEHDITFQAMRKLGLVLHGPRNSAMGRCYDVICPWVDEHSERATSGTAYVPILQRFECHHGHCAARTAEHLGERLDALLRADSGGVFGFIDMEWPDLPDEMVAASMAQKSPADEFRERWVYLRPLDRMFDLERRIAVKDRDVDSAWAHRLRGYLPARGTGNGAQAKRPMSPTQWFLSDPKGRRVDALVSWPGEARVVDHPDGRVLGNVWREVARPLREAPEADVSKEGVKLWLDLFWHVMGTDTLDQIELGETVLDWLAMVLASHVKGGWQVVLIGGQGVGKDLITEPLMRALGTQAQILGAGEITETFNEWVTKRLVQAAEMRQTTRGAMTPHDQMARMKSVFDPGKQWLPINPKYGLKYEARNVVMAWITSNEDTPLRLDEDDRRFLVLDRRGVQRWTDSAFNKLVDWLNAGGDARVAEYLWRRWERMGEVARRRLAGVAPMTPDKASLIEQEQDPTDVLLRECMDAKPPDPEAFADVVSVDHVRDRIIQATKNGRLSGVRPNLHPVSIAKRLARLGAQQPHIKQVEVRGRWYRIWCVRNFVSHIGAAASDLGQMIEDNLT